MIREKKRRVDRNSQPSPPVSPPSPQRQPLSVQPRPPPSNLHHRVPTFFDNDVVNAALAPFKVFGVVVQAQPKSQPRDHRRPACSDYHHRPSSCNSAFALSLRVFAISS
ncbi:hypothetical protein U1Q18_003204, partial [Sarracenia purpurea var. burkii]